MKNNIFLIAGEESGDIIGGALIQQIKQDNHELDFFGVGGERMKKESLVSFFSIEELMITGITGALFSILKVKKLWNIIEEKVNYYSPKLIITIDNPGFNIRLAKRLKKYNIPIFHYGSPQVWMSRKGRIKTIENNFSHLFLQFSFEKKIYKNIATTFVGHPISMVKNVKFNKKEINLMLDIPQDSIIVTILPGSRKQELDKLLSIFIDVACKLKQRIKNIYFILPIVKHLENYVQQTLPEYIKIISSETELLYSVMQHSNCAISALGTSTLELAHFGCPMVAVYKIDFLTYYLIKLLAYLPFYSLPNIFFNKKIVPELLQNKCKVRNIVEVVLSLIGDKKNDMQRTKLLSLRKIYSTDSSPFKIASKVMNSFIKI